MAGQPRTELTVSVDVDATPELTWRMATDWERQGEWVLGTRVRLTKGDGRSTGSMLSAVTGIGPLAFTDPMVIVVWTEPRGDGPDGDGPDGDGPRRCVVRHLGRVVRGDGVFEVHPLPGGRSRFVWTELVDLPLGAVGRLGWPVVRPAVRAGFAASMRRFARICVAGQP
jgi:uncharacterized protein YndB with AHSA1/START domain